mmetsp:Transcript_8834/g.12565  ORF Transcript_8834/g.12565 Transcript_8834/m.12565 type:complete len:278 (+) Transcript_8834:73-906(+)
MVNEIKATSLLLIFISNVWGFIPCPSQKLVTHQYGNHASKLKVVSNSNWNVYRDNSYSSRFSLPLFSSLNDDKLGDAIDDAVREASNLDQSPNTNENTNYPGKIPVRFINFESSGGMEKLAYAAQGTNILKVADEVGVAIPRQCRSGLCGSCTADVKDPTWTEGDRIGFQTVRTCQAGAMLPAGCGEMIIDCYRMSKKDTGNVDDNFSPETANPLSNFADGWEDDFAPDYKGGNIEVLKKTTPEYTVEQGQRSSIEIEKPRWTPRIDSNIPPWETIW